MATIRARREKMDDSDLPSTMAHIHIAYSILSLIAFLSLFFMPWLFFTFVYCLGSLTVFSVPYVILLLCSAPFGDFVGKSLVGMILVALFYALVAYGLLKKKRAASIVAITSNLLTIVADIGLSLIYFFWTAQLPILAISFLGIFVAGIVFNIFLVWIFQDMLRRR